MNWYLPNQNCIGIFLSHDRAWFSDNLSYRCLQWWGINLKKIIGFSELKLFKKNLIKLVIIVLTVWTMIWFTNSSSFVIVRERRMISGLVPIKVIILSFFIAILWIFKIWSRVSFLKSNLTIFRQNNVSLYTLEYVSGHWDQKTH